MSAAEFALRPRVLSVMPTYRCTAACKFCGTRSTPKESTRLTVEEITSAIAQAADLNYELVVFTGGEATLIEEDLAYCIRFAHARSLRTRLVTNGHWCSWNHTNLYLDTLRDVGLGEINFSTGDQHARFVPLENVVRGVCGALSMSMPVSVMVELSEPHTITKRSIEVHPDLRFYRDTYKDSYLHIDESPWMPLNPQRLGKYPEGRVCNARNVRQRKGCESVLQTTTIQADGTINACCGIGLRDIPELHLGRLGETPLSEADRAAADDFLKRWIRIEGPERILAWAAGHEPSIEWENQYAHPCQACKRIYTDARVRKVISEKHTEKFFDVLFAEALRYAVGKDLVDRSS